MADADVALVRASFEAFSARDIDAALATFAPDFELVALRSLLHGTGGYQGHAGFRQFVSDIDEEWEIWRIELDDVRPTPGGQILVLGRIVARGRASGVALESHSAWICDVRDGLMTRTRAFSEPAQALAELGLSERAEL
jgi:ketosteroid isomerase-like protein